MSVYFVPSLIGFIPDCWRVDGTYDDSSWPSDAVLLSTAESDEYWRASPPEGKMLGSTESGRPCWVDIPPPSHAELVSKAEAQKAQLLYEAEQSIRPLERAKRLGIATDAEVALLTELERYSVFLMRVDTSLAPNIEWPQKPQ